MILQYTKFKWLYTLPCLEVKKQRKTKGPYLNDMISSFHNKCFSSTCVHSGSWGADCIFAHCSFPFKPSFQVTKEAVLESWPVLRGESLFLVNTAAHFKDSGKRFPMRSIDVCVHVCTHWCILTKWLENSFSAGWNYFLGFDEHRKNIFANYVLFASITFLTHFLF